MSEIKETQNELENLIEKYKQEIERMKTDLSYKEIYNVSSVQQLCEVISDLEKILKKRG